MITKAKKAAIERAVESIMKQHGGMLRAREAGAAELSRLDVEAHAEASEASKHFSDLREAALEQVHAAPAESRRTAFRQAYRSEPYKRAEAVAREAGRKAELVHESMRAAGLGMIRAYSLACALAMDASGVFEGEPLEAKNTRDAVAYLGDLIADESGIPCELRIYDDAINARARSLWSYEPDGEPPASWRAMGQLGDYAGYMNLSVCQGYGQPHAIAFGSDFIKSHSGALEPRDVSAGAFLEQLEQLRDVAEAQAEVVKAAKKAAAEAIMAVGMGPCDGALYLSHLAEQIDCGDRVSLRAALGYGD